MPIRTQQMSTKLPILLALVLSTLSFANWYDGTDSIYEPYVQSYKTLKRSNRYSLRFVRHERPGASPSTFECRLITSGAFHGLVPVSSSVAVFVNKAHFSIQTDKQTFLNDLLDKCLNASYN